MECERFKRLLKAWYIQIQNEALAPARMVDFMETHVTDCPVCLMDPEAKKDIAKIITLILPQNKLRQTVKSVSAEYDEEADEASDSSDGADEDVVEEDEDEIEDEKDKEDDGLDEDLEEDD